MHFLSHLLAQTPGLRHHCLACSSPSKTPPVKETVSLEAEDHLVFLGVDCTGEVRGVLALIGICHPNVVARDLHSGTVISHPRTKAASLNNREVI